MTYSICGRAIFNVHTNDSGVKFGMPLKIPKTTQLEYFWSPLDSKSQDLTKKSRIGKTLNIVFCADSSTNAKQLNTVKNS